MGRYARVPVIAAVAAVFLPAWPSQAPAYKIIFPYDIHESITRAAAVCIKAQEGREPRNCRNHHAAMLADSYPQLGERYSALEKSSRWSDDPTRGASGPGAAKFLSQLLVECPRITKPTSRLDEVGLTCSSHSGRLQFMHAQASRRLDGSPESDELTRKKMLSWARFAYRVATGDPRAPLHSDYCQTVGGLDHIGPDLAPAGLHQCQPGSKKTWQVASLFNIKCSNPLIWRTCWHQWGPKPDRRAVRFARGAILHMIQDSFSQSHVYRGTGEPPPPKHKFTSKVSCAPATHFYEYNSQSGGHHSAADAPPALDAATCRPGVPVDDVITATARVIWQINHKVPEDSFIEYLDKHVLG